MTADTLLNRSIGLPGIVLYGMGTILGAGIYVLVGEVAAESGRFTALAFIFAGVVVSFTAYSYSRLTREFPVSAGEPAYVQEAFNIRWLSTLVGYAIVLSGLVSSATIIRGAVGYLAVLIDLPAWLMILALGILLTGTAIWSVRLSVAIAASLTLVEVSGLLLIIYAATGHWGTIFDSPEDFFLPHSAQAFAGIGAGAFLAFYACIGFEDMVNMAEEVKNPETTLPRGIAIALVVSVCLYALVALAALAVVPIEELAGSGAPLALVAEKSGRLSLTLITVISIAAVTNGGLVQIVMASRVLYGMASRGLAPAPLARVNAMTRTPDLATALVGGTVLVLAVFFALSALARATSAFILFVFMLVNLSLFKLNMGRQPGLSTGVLVPAAGALVCAFFVALQWWLI